MTDRIMALVVRTPAWADKMESRILRWVREGEEISVTFSPEEIKTLFKGGYVMRFELRTLE